MNFIKQLIFIFKKRLFKWIMKEKVVLFEHDKEVYLINKISFTENGVFCWNDNNG